MSARAAVPALLLAALTLLALPRTGLAQSASEADTSVVELPGTSVTGTRPVAMRGGSSALRSEIRAMNLPAAGTLEDALRRVPMVHVRTNSRGEAELSVRGSESRQVAVLLDGAPLSLSWDGRTDLSVVPIGAIEQVEFSRGLSSLLAGPNALGGVIEFQTDVSPRALRSPKLLVQSGVDEVGGFGASAAVSAPRSLAGGTLTARAGLGHRDTPGAALARDVTEPLPSDDDLRLNTDAKETDGFAALRFDRAGGWMSLMSSASQAERGIAAQLETDAPRFWRYPNVTRSLTVLSGGSGMRSAPWGGEAGLNASFGYDVGAYEIDAFDSRDYSTLDTEEDGDQRTLSMRVQGSQRIGRDLSIDVGVTSSQITFDESLDQGPSNRYRQRMWSVAGESMLRIPMEGTGLLDEIDLSLGAAIDRSTYPLAGGKPALEGQDEWGGRAGINALMADGAFSAHASVNRRARFPSLRELYSGALGRFDPNPNLKPEQLVAFEGGVTWRDSHGTLQVVGFHQQLDDAVVRIRVGPLFRRVNQEGLRSSGVEVVGSRSFGRLALSGDLEAKSVELLDPSAALERPENLPELAGGLRAQFALPSAWTIGAGAHHTGEQFAIDPNTGDLATLPARTRFDADLGRTWRIGAGWATTLHTRLAAENLSDEAIYDAFGLPEPGRTIRFDVRLQ